jgi:S-DNA-T family DNA segregation ATPase FtsK/SpoIIIE
MGDLLFLSSKSSKITRVQGPYVSENEVKRVTDWITDMGKKVEEPQAMLIESLKAQLEQSQQGDEKGGGSSGDVFFGDDDPLFEDVKRIVLETKKASASFLQRRLRIGYSRAARLIDMLEEKGIVGAADGAKPREVFGENLGANADLSGGNGLDESEELPKEGEEGWKKV